MSQPLAKSRRSGKKLRHQAKLERRRLQEARRTISGQSIGPSLGANRMKTEDEQKTPQAEQTASPEHGNSAIADPGVEGEVVQTASEAIEGDVVEEPTTEVIATEPIQTEAIEGQAPAMQANSASEHVDEVREPADNNG